MSSAVGCVRSTQPPTPLQLLAPLHPDMHKSMPMMYCVLPTERAVVSACLPAGCEQDSIHFLSMLSDQPIDTFRDSTQLTCMRASHEQQFLDRYESYIEMFVYTIALLMPIVATVLVHRKVDKC
jgi:hypothetical protein